MWSSQEVTDQPEACQEAGAFGDEPSAPPLVLEEHQETEEHVSESGDKLKIDNEPQQPKAAPRHCRQDRGIRATVGIDIDTKLPVFRGAEKLPLSCSSSSLSSLSNPQDEPKPRQKKSSTAGMATRGMQVKDYFANFDSTDAVSMMNPYLTACAHLLDVEYLLSSLLEMKMLKPDDPILKALETHLESVTEFVTKVGVETDDAFDRSPVDQQQLDALFSAAQETVVVDAMGTSGKIFGAAMSAQRRRSNLTRVLAPAAAENAVEPDEESPGMEKLCLAAEYYTKLFKKISGEESGKNLNLLCLLIDKIGTLTNEISKSQPGKASEILANSNLTDIDIPLDEADDFPEEDSEAAPKFKYVPLDKSEILSTIAEVLPSLIVAKKLRPEASSGSLQNGGDARISEDWTLNDSITDLSQKLLEKHLMRVPEEERMTPEALAFVQKFGDTKAAINALVLLSDELNDFLNQVVITNDDDDENDDPDCNDDHSDDENKFKPEQAEAKEDILGLGVAEDSKPAENSHAENIE